MNSLEGKLAVVTGASSGLGVGFAEVFAQRKGERWAWYVMWYFPIVLGWLLWKLYVNGGDY